MAAYYATIIKRHVSDQTYQTLTQPPFKVLYEIPDFGVFFTFGEDALPILCRGLNEANAVGSVLDERSKPYRVTPDGLEFMDGVRTQRNFKKGIPRGMRKWANIRRTGREWSERDTAFCAALTEPAVVREGHVRFFRRNVRYAYGTPGAKNMLRYSLRSPGGKKDRPLLVFLHGAGDLGYDGRRALWASKPLTILRRQNYHLLVPQLGYEEGSMGEYNSDEFSQALCEAIELIPHVDKSRIYLAGVSMGGYGAVLQCLRKPGFYAACLPSVAALYNLEYHEGPEDMYHRPLDGEAYDILAQTPMWLSYSHKEQACNEPLYEALRARGADVRKTQINLLGHGMSILFFPFWPWKRWMMGKKEG